MIVPWMPGQFVSFRHYGLLNYFDFSIYHTVHILYTLLGLIPVAVSLPRRVSHSYYQAIFIPTVPISGSSLFSVPLEYTFFHQMKLLY